MLRSPHHRFFSEDAPGAAVLEAAPPASSDAPGESYSDGMVVRPLGAADPNVEMVRRMMDEAVSEMAPDTPPVAAPVASVPSGQPAPVSETWEQQVAKALGAAPQEAAPAASGAGSEWNMQMSIMLASRDPEVVEAAHRMIHERQSARYGERAHQQNANGAQYAPPAPVQQAPDPAAEVEALRQKIRGEVIAQKRLQYQRPGTQGEPQFDEATGKYIGGIEAVLVSDFNENDPLASEMIEIITQQRLENELSTRRRQAEEKAAEERQHQEVQTLEQQYWGAVDTGVQAIVRGLPLNGGQASTADYFKNADGTLNTRAVKMFKRSIKAVSDDYEEYGVRPVPGDVQKTRNLVLKAAWKDFLEIGGITPIASGTPPPPRGMNGAQGAVKVPPAGAPKALPSTMLGAQQAPPQAPAAMSADDAGHAAVERLYEDARRRGINPSGAQIAEAYSAAASARMAPAGAI